jgi:tetratricopeptide (TPR) repeat protein
MKGLEASTALERLQDKISLEAVSMTRTKLVALFVAVAGSLLYLHNYFNPPETWESHNKKGVSVFEESRYAEAEKHFVQALELAETSPLNDGRLYFSLSQLAEIYRVQSKFIEAERVLKLILAMDEKKFGSKHLNVALRLNNLAGNYRVRGKYDEAESLLKRALKILEESLGPEHALVGNILEHYSHLLNEMSRSVEAENLEKRYKAIYSRQDRENQ